ncbi:MAG TPA: glutamate racemase, partial [Campylobacterales bacterium]|nr:glutamate racemase [Campylobacterales bacterium]
TMEHYFKSIENPKAIILGCTHFPLIAKELKKYFKNEPILIHSGEAIVEYLESKYDLSIKKEEAELKIFASDNVTGLRKIADSWL